MSEKKNGNWYNQDQRRNNWIQLELAKIYLRLKMKKERDDDDRTISSYVEEREELCQLSIPTLFDYIQHAIQIFLEMHELASEAQDKSNCKFKLKDQYKLRASSAHLSENQSSKTMPSVFERELQKYERESRYNIQQM